MSKTGLIVISVIALMVLTSIVMQLLLTVP
jgi:hypothetical protein